MLRKLEQKDVPYMLEWMHDPAVACNFRADFKNMTEQNAIEFVKNSFTEENIIIGGNPAKKIGTWDDFNAKGKPYAMKRKEAFIAASNNERDRFIKRKER